MPTTRKARGHGRRAPPLHPVWWSRLIDTDNPDPSDYFANVDFDERAAALWAEHGPRILATWPSGTRPNCWWRFQAPRLREIPARFRDCWFVDAMIEPRRKIGGTGEPAHELVACAPAYRLGIVLDWVYVASADPPRFETQHAYLARHGLLAPGERRSTDEPSIAIRIWDPENMQ